jgi:hypothetical protein
MRIGRAHHRGVGGARRGEIVAEPAGAGEEALILLAPERLPN